MIKQNLVEGVFDLPRLVFTLNGNPRSENVIVNLQVIATAAKVADQEYMIFNTPAEITEFIEGGISPRSMTVLYDQEGSSKHFTMKTRSRLEDTQDMPSWAHGAQWGVAVHRKVADKETRATNCAEQLFADFYANFKARLAGKQFPWGLPRTSKNEPPPMNVDLPQATPEVMTRLNSGPDLAAAIAHQEYAMELPAGSKISWYRVVPKPMQCDMQRLENIVRAMRNFETACSKILDARCSYPRVEEKIMAGVDLANDPRLRDLYMHPGVDRFSIARPDLHFTGEGVFASENDEMPGGLPELVHIDHSYSVNEKRWERFFFWLFSYGPVVFLVSDEWSKPYLNEINWLVGNLQKYGYLAHTVTTTNASELTVRDSMVAYKSTWVGTIWRQFPIFETRGHLIDLVAAARDGKVRMVPEFSHFGNKAWFAMYRRYHDFFESVLRKEDVTILDEVLPDSHVITGEESFPCTVAGIKIESLHNLKHIREDYRDRILLKVCGANNLAARSYGVLMGHGLTLETWRKWIDERLTAKQPFIVQRRLPTGVAHIPVHNTKAAAPELFPCRILLRPWVYDDTIVSVSGCAVPSSTTRVHGRVDMAIIPFDCDYDHQETAPA